MIRPDDSRKEGTMSRGGFYSWALTGALAWGAFAPTAARADTDGSLQDLGPTASSDVVTATLVLKVRKPDLLEVYDRLVQDPNAPLYHQFLSVNEFVLLR